MGAGGRRPHDGPAGPQIALATSLADLPPGDAALLEALRRQGARAAPAIWSSSCVDWAQYDLVVIRSCWDYHLRLNEFLAWVAALDAAGVRVLNVPALVRWNARKTYLRELDAIGLPVPETLWLDERDTVDVAAVCRARGWERAVVKPVVSASAYRTARRRTGIARGPAMVQAFQPAILREGEWSVVFLGGRRSHDVRKRARASDFRVQQEHGGTAHVEAAPGAVRALAGRAVSHLPVPAAFARIDIVADGDEARLMEVEVIEPELFLDLVPGAADRAASVLLKV
jgi:glutathione synthase/RimK-type ligase-like ATP-grasp enzyme